MQTATVTEPPKKPAGTAPLPASEAAPIATVGAADPGCHLCGSTAHRTLFPYRRRSIRQCLSCTLVTLWPQPTRDELSELYRGARYFKSDTFERGGYTDYNKDEPLLVASARARLARIEGVIGAAQGKRLLDVGCATGFFLRTATQGGYDATGVELSEYASDFARTQNGQRVITGRIEDVPPSEGPFDVVHMGDVIEHLNEPVVELRRVRGLLTPEGVVAIQTPDVGSITSKIFGSRWFHYKEDHLYYFSHATLTTALRQAGLEPFAMLASPMVVTPSALARHLSRYSRPLAEALDGAVEKAGFAEHCLTGYFGEMLCLARRA